MLMQSGESLRLTVTTDLAGGNQYIALNEGLERKAVYFASSSEAILLQPKIRQRQIQQDL